MSRRERPEAVEPDGADELARLRDDDSTVWVSTREVRELRRQLARGERDGLIDGLMVDVAEPRPFDDEQVEWWLRDPGMGVWPALVRQRRREAVAAYCEARGRDAAREWRTDPDGFRAEFGHAYEY